MRAALAGGAELREKGGESEGERERGLFFDTISWTEAEPPPPPPSSHCLSLFRYFLVLFSFNACNAKKLRVRGYRKKRERASGGRGAQLEGGGQTKKIEVMS